jgi:hypothetical protein
MLKEPDDHGVTATMVAGKPTAHHPWKRAICPKGLHKHDGYPCGESVPRFEKGTGIRITSREILPTGKILVRFLLASGGSYNQLSVCFVSFAQHPEGWLLLRPGVRSFMKKVGALGRLLPKKDLLASTSGRLLVEEAESPMSTHEEAETP